MGLHLTLSDIVLSARYVAQLPADQQAKLCAQLFERVNEAAEHVEVTGQPHAFYGDGSASSYLLRQEMPALPAYLDARVLDALGLVLLQAHRFISLKEM